MYAFTLLFLIKLNYFFTLSHLYSYRWNGQYLHRKVKYQVLGLSMQVPQLGKVGLLLVVTTRLVCFCIFSFIYRPLYCSNSGERRGNFNAYYMLLMKIFGCFDLYRKKVAYSHNRVPYISRLGGFRCY